MNDIEILKKLENMQQTFIEEGLQGYEMVIINTKNIINKLIARNKELEEHTQKFYNAELFTAKQVKLIEKDYIPKLKLKEIYEKDDYLTMMKHIRELLQ